VSTDNQFKELLQRVRDGNQEAAAELFQQYEPAVRIEVRRRLHDPYLNASFDSEDICQSVMKSFFLRAAAGEYELNAAEDLMKLLARMARNKVANKVRHAHAQIRDPRRLEGGTETVERLANGPPPDRVAAGKELLQRFRELLSDEERQLADLRASGRTWPEIAAEIGGEAQTHRRKLERALNRVLGQLGLEEEY
jgi:RNA polymerase sigma-70 factor (ECF subfamily)